jgi:hypothetical protein
MQCCIDHWSKGSNVNISEVVKNSRSNRKDSTFENEHDLHDKEKDDFLITDNESSSDEEIQSMKKPNVTLTKPDISTEGFSQKLIKPGVFQSK